MRKLLLLVCIVFFPITLLAQSSSPNATSTPSTKVLSPGQASPEGGPITFSEFPNGTPISNQYADRGILFGGDSPFITSDASNPTSPVLSGSPIFQGAIEGTFVRPGDEDTETAVKSFTLDAGFFDAFGSTRLSWFDKDGEVLGQRINSTLGIETFHIEGDTVAKWRIEIFGNEPAGFAVDNVDFEPIGPSIVFREKRDGDEDGTWGFGDDAIPGFDHMALHFENVVYESHPGYPTGTYVSEDGAEDAFIVHENGVQGQHTLETFRHDSMLPGSPNSPVIDFQEISIPDALAASMKSLIETQDSATFQYIDFSTAQGIEDTLSPTAQKGGDGTFTCVGLVEWAAEQAGHNGGQGFVRDIFESFPYLDFSEFPPVLREAPLLSPQLVNYAMRGAITLDQIQEWIQGLFDPVDFVITDSLGRRLGYTAELGRIQEIPLAFFSGNGNYEQFLIPNPVPGQYRFDLVGTGSQAVAAFATTSMSEGVNRWLSQNELARRTTAVALSVGAPGDVTLDGQIDTADRGALIAQLNTFTDGLGDPADLSGDGRIDDEDLALLDILIGQFESTAVGIDLEPEDYLNRVDPLSDELVIVEIVTTTQFDALDVDPQTVAFGPNDAQPFFAQTNKDRDEDGDIDLFLFFLASDIGLNCSSTSVQLAGQTFGGQEIRGLDFVTTTNCL